MTTTTSAPVSLVPLFPDEKLSLTNSGNLEIFFTGVGNADAEKNHNLNLILIKGSDHVMVDFGFNAKAGLRKNARLGVLDIDTFLITHSHSDHIGGLETVALNRRYVGPRVGKGKPKMVITPAYQEILWDRSLRGGLEWNEEDKAENRRLAFTDYFEPIRPRWARNFPREAYRACVGDINIEMFRTKHVPDNAKNWEDSFSSFGLFVDEHVFISMDSRFDPELIEEYADRSSVMFHDVQFFPGAVHAPLADLKTLPNAVKAKMHLMHYADTFDKQDIAGFAGWAKEGVRYVFGKAA